MVSMMAEESLNKNSSQEHSSDESLSESLSHPVGLEFLNNKIPLVPEEDSFVPSHAEGDVDMEEGEECVKDSYKHIMVGKDGIVIIGLCNFCQGPIFRTCKTGIDDTKFCSVRCLSGYSKMKMHLQQRDSTGREQEDGRDFQLPAEFSFDEFRDIIELRGAQPTCFKRITKEVKGLKPGMKLEVLDKNNPCNYCVATVIDVVGHRVQICYDGFGDDEGQDFWCNFQSEELFPIGWCAGNGYPLQPPCGISSSLEDWKTFLTKTLTGALAAPQELFRPGEERMQLHVHSFQAGTHVECINPKKPDVVCPATVTKSLGPYHYQVSTEPHQSCPSSQFFGHSETLGLFQVGWARKHGIALWFPSALYLQDGPDGRPCIQLKKFPAGGAHFSKRPRCNRFKVGQKLEAVDTLDHSVIRIATILWVTGRLLLLYFDGTQRCQFVDCESEELYPCGWSKSTGHPLHTCYGVVLPNAMVTAEKVATNHLESRAEYATKIVKLASFKSVVKPPQAFLGRKAAKEKGVKEMGKNQDDQDGRVFNLGELCSVHINRYCNTGPYIDRAKFEEMPPITKEARVPQVICAILEFILAASKNYEHTAELMQDVTGNRVFPAGKGFKLNRKGLQRYEKPEKAVKFLKRLSNKLNYCEFLFSINTPRMCAGRCCHAQHSAQHRDHGLNVAVSSASTATEKTRISEPNLTLNLPSAMPNPPNVTTTTNEGGLVKHQLLYKGRPLIPIAPGVRPMADIPVSSGITTASLVAPVSLFHSVISTIPSGTVNPVHVVSSQQRLATPLNIRLLSPSVKQVDRSTTKAGSGIGTLFVVKSGESVTAAVDGGSVTPTPVKQVIVTKDPQPGHLKGLESKAEPMVQAVHTQTSPGIPFSRNAVPKIGHPLLLSQGQSKGLPEEFIPIGGQSTMHSMVPEPRPDLKKSLGPDNIYPSVCIYSPAIHGAAHAKSEDGKKIGSGSRPEECASAKAPLRNVSAGLLNVVKVPRIASSPLSPSLEESSAMKSKPRQETGGTVSLVQLRGLLCDKTASLNHSLHVISSPESAATTHESSPSSSIVPQATTTSPMPIHVNVTPGRGPNLQISSRSFPSGPFSPVQDILHNSVRAESLKGPVSIRSVLSGPPISTVDTQPLKVLTGHSIEGQSPLHSPPPLRPAPAGSLRTVALRSPPHLYPSATSSPRFEFPGGKSPVTVESKSDASCGTNDMFTKGVQVSPGALKEENGPLRTSDNERAIMRVRPLHHGIPPGHRKEEGERAGELDSLHGLPVTDKIPFYATQTVPPQGHLHTCSQGFSGMKLHSFVPPHLNKVGNPRPALLPAVRPAVLPGSSSSAPTATTTVTVTLTYVPVQSHSKDKVVYLPVNRAHTQSTQKVVFYQQPGGMAIMGNPMSSFVRTTVPCRRPVVPYGNQAPKVCVGNAQGNPSADEASRHFETFRIQGSSFKDIESRVREAARKENEERERADRERKKNLKRRRTKSSKSLSGSDNGDKVLGKVSGLLEEWKTSPGSSKGLEREGKEDVAEIKGDVTEGYSKWDKGQSINGDGHDVKGEQETSNSEDSCFDIDDLDDAGDLDDDERKDEDEDDKEEGSERKQDWRQRKRKRKSLKKRFTRRKGETTPLKFKGKDSAFSRLFDGNSSDPEMEIVPRSDSELDSVKNVGPVDGLDYKGSYFPKARSGDAVPESLRGASHDGKEQSAERHQQDVVSNGEQALRRKRFIVDPLSKVQLPKNPETWTPQQVAEFINATDCAEHASKLVDEEIDGQSLLLLTREALMEFTGMKLGPALKICSFVAQLKAKLRMQQFHST